jgi:D-alanyl-D-alanine carboxypeptidase (penicillin-binding protein 5/6)
MMKYLPLKFVLSLFLSFTICLPLQAAPTLIPAPPKIPAQGYFLMDFNSGHIIAEKAADERMEPASITKIMVTYIAEQELRNGNLKLDDMVTVSEKAWRAEGSRMFIEVNTKVSVQDLLRGIIIQSGNDATIALAEHLAGTEQAFAAIMNQYAASLGMTNTHFVNSTGLPDPEHYTTARDLAILSRALIRDFPEQYSWYKEKVFSYNSIKQYNRNRLLWRDNSVDGIKTGHTESAGYCLVASAMRDDMRLISVVLGTDSEKAREQASLTLLNYGFRFFETGKLFDAGQPLVNAKLWKGAADTVALGLPTDLYLTVPRGQFSKLQTVLGQYPYLEAPLQQGKVLGKLNITLQDEVIDSRDLVALNDAPAGSFFSRLLDTIQLFFIRLFE